MLQLLNLVNGTSKSNEKQTNCMKIWWKDKLTQQYYDNNGYLFIHILSEAAQEHSNNNNLSNRHSTPQMGLKHAHTSGQMTDMTTTTPKLQWLAWPPSSPKACIPQPHPWNTIPIRQAGATPLGHPNKRKPNIPYVW